MLTILMESPYTIALGWTVLHSLWQGALIALLLRVCLTIGHRWRANTQYRLAISALFFQLVASIVTSWWLWPNAAWNTETPSTVAGTTTFLVGTTPLTDNITKWAYVENWLLPALPFITALWFLGMIFFLVRLVLGYTATQSIRKSARKAPAAWQEALMTVIAQMQIKRSISIAVSQGIESPLLLGVFRPLILIPIGLINQLEPAEVIAILRHELAHFKRFDHLAYLIQLLVESIFYYHPAIWWIGQGVRRLREEACDEMALQEGATPLPYAKTLVKITELSRFSSVPPLALGMKADNSKRLLQRIQRILHTSQKQPDMREKMLVTSLLLAVAIFVSLAASWPNDYYQTTTTEATALVGITDSFPKGNIRMETDENGKTMSVEIKDQAIQSLVIDGKEIPASEYDQYIDEVEEMMANVPVPPAPPAPPAPPGSIAPPAPPAPPSPPSGATMQIKERREVNEDGDYKTITIEREYTDETVTTKGNEERTIIVKTIEDGENTEVKVYKIGADDEEIEIDGHTIRQREEDGKIIVEIETEMEEQQEAMEHAIEKEVEVRIIEKEFEESVMDAEELVREVEVMVESIQSGQMDDEDWGRQLQADGLIEDANNFSLKLNTKRMKVSGKTMSAATHQHYMELFEERTGQTFSDRTSINVMRRLRE